ncbi:MAG: hypothetical protein ACOVOY_04475 [Sediminibacterium sp.]|jgi:hypothetical protein
MKKVLLALLVIIAFGSCKENACLKYVKMSGRAIKESIPAGCTEASIGLSKNQSSPSADFSLLHPMESGVDRMTR